MQLQIVPLYSGCKIGKHKIISNKSQRQLRPERSSEKGQFK